MNIKSNKDLKWSESEESVIPPFSKNERVEECRDGRNRGTHTYESESTPGLDLGEYYIDRAKDAMEQWHSKPRDGYHVSDVCLCPRLNVFRKFDRRPIDAKTVSIYSAGKATHEAVQLLYRSDKRTFEIEKYVEHEDIQGSIDIYDRRRNTPLAEHQK